jgi:hypothetical protein
MPIDEIDVEIAEQSEVLVLDVPAAADAIDVPTPGMEIVIADPTVDVVDTTPNVTEDITQPVPGPPGPTGPPGPPGSGGGGGGGTLDPSGSTIVAAVDIAAFSVVTVDGHIANSGNLTHIGRVAGIAVSDIALGVSGLIQLDGEITNPAWNWIPNSKLFLNGSGLSAVAPATGFAQMIAIARSDQTIIIRIGDPILL